MGEVFSDVASVQEEPMCMAGGEIEVTAEDVEGVVDGLVGFLNDDEQGIGAVLNLVGALSSVED